MAFDGLPPLPPLYCRAGVGGVLLRDGRALVNRAVYRTQFTIPSGFVEPGEGLEAALVREFEEETGMTVRTGRLLLVRYKVLGPEESDVYFAFAVERVSGEPEARLPEIAEVREVPVDEAVRAPWISELSRTAIELGGHPGIGWDRATQHVGETAGQLTEAYRP